MEIAVSCVRTKKPNGSALSYRAEAGCPSSLIVHQPSAAYPEFDMLSDWLQEIGPCQRIDFVFCSGRIAIGDESSRDGVRVLGGVNPDSARCDVGAHQGPQKCFLVWLRFRPPPSHRSWSVSRCLDGKAQKAQRSWAPWRLGHCLVSWHYGLAWVGQAARLGRGPIGDPVRSCHWFRVTSASPVSRLCDVALPWRTRWAVWSADESLLEQNAPR